MFYIIATTVLIGSFCALFALWILIWSYTMSEGVSDATLQNTHQSIPQPDFININPRLDNPIAS